MKMTNKETLPTPCYVVEEAKIKKNLEILKGVMDRTGARILLAQKAFSTYSLYPLIGEYLAGATASGIYEARLGYEEMVTPLKAKGIHVENHVFSPAFGEVEFDEILKYCDHIVFNSPRQVELYAKKAKDAGKSVGLRMNPQFSTQEGHAIYDPCAPGSRLGTTLQELEAWVDRMNEERMNEERMNGERMNGDAPNGDVIGIRSDSNSSINLCDILDGLHFHTLCEQDSDDLEKTLNAFEEKFGRYLQGMKWVNFGGGHHITRDDYDIERLEKCIRRMQDKYGVTVYLEPGEAVALNAGYLVCEVREIQHKDINIAILDTSAACHMPDVIEMPYRPPLKDSGEAGEKAHTYRLGGPTCLAGDVIGDYSFDQELKEGDRLYFQDMAIYSMVKNNTFNGMPLPAIAIEREDGSLEIIRQFGYEDFKMRL